MRLAWLCQALVMWVLLSAAVGYAQDGEPLRAGVVKITARSDGQRKTGAGFIVKLESNIAYIVTAAHVVAGDRTPQVEFFTRQNAPVKAEVRKIEGGDLQGLALMVVRGRENLPAGLIALKLGTSVPVSGGGDAVTAIGFPSGLGSWGVLHVDVVALEGRNIVLSKDLEEGNSGGPVLKDDQVIGIVMGLRQGFALALPASLVRTVLTNWGVNLPAESTAGVEPTPPPRSDPPAPRDDANPPPPAGKGLTLDTTRLEFGQQEVCAGQEKRLQLTNRSAATVRVNRVSIDDARAFSAQGCIDQTIAAGASCTLSVRFMPKTTGAFQGLLTILSSADSQPQFVTTAGVGAAEGVCCWFGYIYPMNKESCAGIRGTFALDEDQFFCRKPRLQPYPVRPDCPPRK